MGYLFGLILILGIIFSATTPGEGPVRGLVSVGTTLASDLWQQATEKVKEFAFPKSQKEIVIDNLGNQYSELEKFFSSIAPELISSDAISAQDKEALKRAIQVFGESQSTINQIKKLEKEGKSITKALVVKLLGLNEKSDLVPDPTHIPPNCNLVCE